jgi:hypothetical protein
VTLLIVAPWAVVSVKLCKKVIMAEDGDQAA